MYVCDKCGKGVLRGNAVSHAKNRTKRIFMPNLHNVKMLANGQVSIIRVCTKCLRKVERAPKRNYVKPETPKEVKAEIKAEVKQKEVVEPKEEKKKTKKPVVAKAEVSKRGRPKKVV